MRKVNLYLQRSHLIWTTLSAAKFIYYRAPRLMQSTLNPVIMVNPVKANFSLSCHPKVNPVKRARTNVTVLSVVLCINADDNLRDGHFGPL